MPGFIKLNALKKHKATIWNICWSSFGEFLISCGADGIVLIWGPNSKIKLFNSLSKIVIDFYMFSHWSNLCKFESFSEFRTHRNIDWSYNLNEFCVCSFSGVCQLCKIVFFDKNKSISLKKEGSITGPYCEIKNCTYSRDGEKICIASRNKTILIWEKNKKSTFDCLSIIAIHESDVKYSKWHPNSNFIATTTYEGIIRFFFKKKKKLLYKGKISLINSTVWNINFNQNGSLILTCTNRGDFQFYKKNKIKKKKNIFFFFFLSIFRIFFFSFSIFSSLVLYSGNEDGIGIIKKCKYWIKEKKSNFLYGGVSKFFRFKVETYIHSPHLGDVNSLAWHPNNNNILASSGDDGTVCIWNYNQTNLFI